MRFVIKKLFWWSVGLVVGIGLTLACLAYAQSNNQDSPELSQSDYLSYQESVIYKNPDAEQKAFEVWKVEQAKLKAKSKPRTIRPDLTLPLIERAEALKGTWQGECVVAVRAFLGLVREQTTVRGAARDIRVDGQEPRLGATIKLAESELGHVAVVIQIEGSRLYIYESNYSFDGRARTRWISINDPNIQGYIYDIKAA